MAPPTLDAGDKRIPDLLPWLGWWISGDLGAYTVYTNRNGRIVFYPRAPPTKPPSPSQLKQRYRFALAQAQWQSETPGTQQQWKLLANRLALAADGHGVYMSLCLSGDPAALATANRKTRLNLNHPNVIPK